MKILNSAFAAAAALFLLVGVTPASADATLTYKTPDGQIPFKAQVSGDKVRFENNGGDYVTIIDLAAGTVHTVLHPYQMVTVIDGGSSGRMAELVRQSEEAQKKMLSALPDEYAKAIGTTLKTAKGIAKFLADRVSPDRVELVNTGVQKTVAGHDCTVWNTVADDEVWTESCIAPAADLGLQRADTDKISAASLMAIALAQDISAQSDLGIQVSIKMSQLDGAAVEMVQHKHNLGTWTLSEASDDPVPESQFAIPSGYKVNKI